MATKFRKARSIEELASVMRLGVRATGVVEWEAGRHSERGLGLCMPPYVRKPAAVRYGWWGVVSIDTRRGRSDESAWARRERDGNWTRCCPGVDARDRGPRLDRTVFRGDLPCCRCLRGRLSAVDSGCASYATRYFFVNYSAFSLCIFRDRRRSGSKWEAEPMRSDCGRRSRAVLPAATWKMMDICHRNLVRSCCTADWCCRKARCISRFIEYLSAALTP